MSDSVSEPGNTSFVVAIADSGKKPAPVKVKFTPEEDEALLKLVQQFGTKDWIKISTLIGTRNPRQCRERFKNYLNPELRKDQWTKEEDELLEQKFKEFGAKWNKISKFFVHRSDNALRNRWMMIARHRAKAMHGRSGHVHSCSPPSPPAASVQQMVTIPAVLPIVSEGPASHTALVEDSLEMFGSVQEDFPAFNLDNFEAWTALGDF